MKNCSITLSPVWHFYYTFSLKHWFYLMVCNHHKQKHCMLLVVHFVSVSASLNYRIIWLIGTMYYPLDSKLEKKAILPSLRKIIDLISLPMLPSFILLSGLETLKLFFTLSTFHYPHRVTKSNNEFPLIMSLVSISSATTQVQVPIISQS